MLDDSEYLTVTGPFEDSSERGLLGAWLALVNDRSFDGLVAFFEFTIRDWPGDPKRPAAAGGTLVLCGHLQRKGFRLEGDLARRSRAGNREPLQGNRLARRGPSSFWTPSNPFATACRSPAPRNYFDSRYAQRRSNWFASLLIHVPGEGSIREGRLKSFLFRVGFHFSEALLLAVLIYIIPDGLVKGILAACLALPVGALGFVLGFEIWRVCKLYCWRCLASLMRAYRRPSNMRPSTPRTG